MAHNHVTITNREIPQELLSAARGGKVELTMEDRRNEEYNPPKPKMVAFSGEGYTLGKWVYYKNSTSASCIMINVIVLLLQ